MALDLNLITNELSYFGNVELIEEHDNKFILVMSDITISTIQRLNNINNVLNLRVVPIYFRTTNYGLSDIGVLKLEMKNTFDLDEQSSDSIPA